MWDGLIAASRAVVPAGDVLRARFAMRGPRFAASRDPELLASQISDGTEESVFEAVSPTNLVLRRSPAGKDVMLISPLLLRAAGDRARRRADDAPP